MSDEEEVDLRINEDDYEPNKDCEDYEDYKVDGYHPVQLGETYKDGQYKVIQKLGWGAFSTVWLVNEQYTENYSALKIQKSKESYQESAIDELKLLQDMMKYKFDKKWFTSLEKQLGKHAIEVSKLENYCVNMTDNFIHYGMHGKHYCTTFEILGPSLLDLINEFHDEKKNRCIHPQLVKIMVRQMLIGMDYMHRICNIIHTDIKPENIMIQIQPEDTEKFIDQVKSYKKKPLSEKFLMKLRSTGDAKKRKKKYNKKKMKKKRAKERKRLAKLKKEKEEQERLDALQKQLDGIVGAEPIIKNLKEEEVQKEGGKDDQQQQKQPKEEEQQKEQDTTLVEKNKVQPQNEGDEEEKKEDDHDLQIDQPTTTTVVSKEEKSEKTQGEEGEVQEQQELKQELKIEKQEEIQPKPTSNTIQEKPQPDKENPPDPPAKDDSILLAKKSTPQEDPAEDQIKIETESPSQSQTETTETKAETETETEVGESQTNKEPPQKAQKQEETKEEEVQSQIIINQLVKNIKSLNVKMLDPSIVNSSTKKTQCPAKHNLKKFNTPTKTYTCDKCKKHVKKHSTMFGCRECDWDCCPQCFEGDQGNDEEDEDSEESEPFTNIYTPGEVYLFQWKNNINVKIDENIKIKIVDFGNACWTNKHFTNNIQTREYRSPEAIIGAKYYPNTDIWSLACMVFEMLTGDFLFKPSAGDGFTKDDEHLAMIMEEIGPLPKRFALSGKFSRDFFNKSGKLKDIKNIDQNSSLKKSLIEKYDYSQDEAREISNFLLPLLVIQPNKRISAFDALKLKWLWN